MTILCLGAVGVTALFLGGCVLVVLSGLTLLKWRETGYDRGWRVAAAAADDAATCLQAYSRGDTVSGVVRLVPDVRPLDAFFSGQWCVACRVDFGLRSESIGVEPVRTAAQFGCVPFVLEEDGQKRTVALAGDIQFVPGVAAGRRLLWRDAVDCPPGKPAVRSHWREAAATADEEARDRFFQNDWDLCVADAALCAGLPTARGGFDIHTLSMRQALDGAFVEWTLERGDRVTIYAGNGIDDVGGRTVLHQPWIWVQSGEAVEDQLRRLDQIAEAARKEARMRRRQHRAAVTATVLAGLVGIGMMAGPVLAQLVVVFFEGR